MPPRATASAEGTDVTARTPLLPDMENILISLLALGCLVYLVVAVLRPEKF